MPFRILICVCLCVPQTVFAKKKIWVRSLYSSFPDFQIFINTHSGWSYAEYLLQQKRQEAKNFQIKKKLISAQQFYLEGREQEAKEAFLEISHKAYLADWGTEDRRIFIYTFLRLAQFEKNKEKQRAFLILAQHFLGVPITKDNYPDFELFPPPLMDDLQKIQDQHPMLTVQLEALFPHHEILLLNGKRMDKHKALSLFQAHYRLTALSSSHQAWSKKVNLSKLFFKKIQTQTLTEGACPYSQLKVPLNQAEVVPVSRCPDKNPLAELSPPWKAKENTTEESNKDFYKKNVWLTVGAGVLLLSLMFFLAGKKEKESEDRDYIF